MWHLYLFDGLSLVKEQNIAFDDHRKDSVRLRTRSTGSLLAYLALHPGLHSRESLAALLWPDSTQERAFNNLRVSLSSLRRQLEPVGTLPGSAIVSDRFRAGIHDKSFYCDAVVFQQHWKAAQQTSGSSRIMLLQTAFELYHGPLLLGYQVDWNESLAIYLESLYERIARELIAWHRELGEFDVAQSLAARATSCLDGDAEFTEYVAELRKNPSSKCLLLTPELGEAKLHPVSGDADAAITDRRPVSLPIYPTQFWGRTTEIEKLLQAINADTAMALLTLVGMGGMGKTRLAVEAATQASKSELLEEVYFVSCAAVQSAPHLTEALRTVLGLRTAPGVEPSEQVIEALRLRCRQNPGGRKVLLLLDNLEHLLPEVVPLVQMLRLRLPQLLIWITSRAPLRLPGEELLLLSGLPTPPEEAALTSIADSPSVGLYLQRARGVKPDFTLTPTNAPMLAELCRHLEGWPLALELAAARANSFTPTQMLAQLQSGRGVLMRKQLRHDPILARQSSLHNAIEWSYRLLSPRAAQLLLSLTAFQGGATAEKVEAVTGEQNILTALSELVAHSLVTTFERNGVLRYDMLEGVRQFARAYLTEVEWQELSRRHAHTFAEWLQGSDRWIGEGSIDWLQQLDAEQENVNLALAWAQEFDPDLLLRLARSLWRYWEARGLSRAGSEWLRKALAQSASGSNKDLNFSRIDASNGLSRLYFAGGEFAKARIAAEQALAGASSQEELLGAAHAQLNLGRAALYTGKIEEARQALQISHDNFDGEDASGSAQASIYLGIIAIFTGDYVKAFQTYQKATAVARDCGDSESLALALFYCGDVLGPVSGLYDEAVPYFHEALAITERGGNDYTRAYANWGLSRAAIAASDFTSAAKYFQCLHRFCGRSSFEWGQVFVIETASLLASARNDWEEAALFLGAAEAARERLKFPLTPSYYAQFDRHLAPLWEKLTPAALQKSWRRGRGHTLAQAMDAAAGQSVAAAELHSEEEPPCRRDASCALPLGFPLDSARAWPLLAASHLGAGRLALFRKELVIAQESFVRAREYFHRLGDAEGLKSVQPWLRKAAQRARYRRLHR